MCGNVVLFGEFGLKVIGCGCLIVCQIEVVCCVMMCYIKCGGCIWIWIFLDKLILQKLVEVCMGNGKGNLEYYVVEIQLGKMFYEMDGVIEELVCEVFCLVVVKLLLKMVFIVCQFGV